MASLPTTGSSALNSNTRPALTDPIWVWTVVPFCKVRAVRASAARNHSPSLTV
ncbi:hypothetical protein [Mesorhizobium sp.]|uniref:hypothetical protein n=1 Tax=Mesorhizobium sp. TaxID=1871066 RepID=UPI00257EA080|nr:hypothetical protein [Mesorhizobium sp.]